MAGSLLLIYRPEHPSWLHQSNKHSFPSLIMAPSVSWCLNYSPACIVFEVPLGGDGPLQRDRGSKGRGERGGKMKRERSLRHKTMSHKWSGHGSEESCTRESVQHVTWCAPIFSQREECWALITSGMQITIQIKKFFQCKDTCKCS